MQQKAQLCRVGGGRTNLSISGTAWAKHSGEDQPQPGFAGSREGIQSEQLLLHTPSPTQTTPSQKREPEVWNGYIYVKILREPLSSIEGSHWSLEEVRAASGAFQLWLSTGPCNLAPVCFSKGSGVVLPAQDQRETCSSYPCRRPAGIQTVDTEAALKQF